MLKTLTLLAALLALPSAVGQNSDLNHRDSDGRTALMRAASAGQVDEVKALIAARANIELKDPIGQTALGRAAGAGHADIVRLLLKAGAGKEPKKDPEIVIMAVKHDYVDVVRALLEAGADKDAPFFDRTSFTRIRSGPAAKTGASPVISGSSLGGHEVTVTAVSPGFENVSGDICQTLLTHSAQQGNTELVKVLLDAGASSAGCLRTYSGRVQSGALVYLVRFSVNETPLDAATQGRHQDIVDLLTSAQAKP